MIIIMQSINIHIQQGSSYLWFHYQVILNNVKYEFRRSETPHGKDFFLKNVFIYLKIERKLWKVVQYQIKLMMINFKFEAPIINAVYRNVPGMR